MEKISLNGLWSFIPELDPDHHINWRQSQYLKPDFCRSNWKTAPVPGVWQKHGERYDIFEGVCWFCREFDAGDFPAGSPARIRFGAVNYSCAVYLNGKEAGRHEGGYTEFLVDVSGLLAPGKNHILIKVDNRSSLIKWPPCLGYFNYGGIHRDVTLEIAKDSSFDDVCVLTDLSGAEGVLKISGKILNRGGRLSLSADCGGETFQSDINPDGSFLMEGRIKSVKSWSPESPSLYPLSLRLLRDGRTVDERTSHCGFRRVEVQGRKVHLNGRVYPLKGICYVYDSPVLGLRMDRETVERDIALIKETGANAVRTHYPMDKIFYETCDREGLLVWIEIPVYCYLPGDDEKNTFYSNPEWIEAAQRMAGEMTLASRSHTSVTIYGIGNECNLKNPEAFEFFRGLAEKVRAAGSGRLVSFAALYGNVGELSRLVDILGVNSYWGWYEKLDTAKKRLPDSGAAAGAAVQPEPIDLSKMREMLAHVLEANKDKPLFLTEFGADSLSGFVSASRDLWSENYHADLLTEVLKLAAEYPEIAGTFPFCFSDYRDPSKAVNAYWNEMNLKGVVDYHRNIKHAFHALKKSYKNTV
jgi:beta-glucuronidase